MSTLWKWQEVIGGLLMIIVGVIFLVMPELAPQTNLIAQVAAAAMAAAGLIFIIVYFVRRRSNVIGYDLVKVAVLIAAAVLVYLNKLVLASSISLVLGILILLCGILVAQRSIDLRHFGGSAWILLMVAALLSIIDAVLIILNPFAAARWLMYLILGGMIFAGAFLVISALTVGHRVSKYMAEHAEETAEPAYPYKPQKPAYTPPEPAYTQPKPTYTAPEPAYTAPETSYTPPEPAYTASEPVYENTGVQFPDERPVETEIPAEVDLPPEEKPAEGGFRGLFKRKKS